MASKVSGKPLISGGRTLSKMLRGSKSGGAGGKKNKKAVWYQAGDKANNRGKLGSWPVGEIPEDVRKRVEKK